MDPAPLDDSARPGARIALLFLIFLVLAASRRWQQLTSPQVWAEDGRLFASFVETGWRGTFQPVNGYMVVVPRVVTAISLLLSTYYYPVVSTVIACLFAAAVGTAVAISPTSLSGKVLCAASVFLVPSDAEVFGPPLYTLWWAPILLLLLALWDERSPALLLRLAYLAVGGLSSPYILVVLPVLWLRAFRFRKSWAEPVVAAAATVVAIAQARFIVVGGAMGTPPWPSFVKFVVPRFCGWFLAGGVSESGYLLWPAGILVIALFAAFLFSNRHNPFAWILVYLYLGSVASSILRIDPAALHPLRGGPRYFFFPFFLTSWMLIQFAITAERKWVRGAAALAALVGALDAIPQWTRHHDDLQWAENLVSARLFPEYGVPIESDGHRSRAWAIEEPGATWDCLLRKDRFLSPAERDARPTFAYRIVSERELAAGGRDAPGSGRAISVSVAGAGKRRAFSLSAESRVRYRSGPARRSPFMEVVGHKSMFIQELPITADWVTLEFSNSRLPREFTVKVEDRGQGVGEWAPVAILP